MFLLGLERSGSPEEVQMEQLLHSGDRIDAEDELVNARTVGRSGLA
jgi:hypothetical protein